METFPGGWGRFRINMKYTDYKGIKSNKDEISLIYRQRAGFSPKVGVPTNLTFSTLFYKNNSILQLSITFASLQADLFIVLPLKRTNKRFENYSDFPLRFIGSID